MVTTLGAGAATGKTAKAIAPAPLLPETFGGLHLETPATFESGSGAAAADASHAALLREAGLLDAGQGSYIGDGPNGPGTVTIRAFHFGDATGAYAAFTAYRQTQMHHEAIGVEGASLGGEYLFWIGSSMVTATATHPDAHALAALRELAHALPRPHGPAAVAPPLAGYLPTAGLEVQSVHYAIGPAGYAFAQSPLPESVIDFSRDAEVITAKYSRHGEAGTLTLLGYPTPQMAANREKALAALLASGAPPLTVGDPAVVAERIGPLVAFTSGSLSAAEAHALVRDIHYDAAITINHPEGYVSEVSKAAKLLLGIAYLTGILGVAAVLLAVFLGGARVLVRRLRGQPDSSMNDDEFISLKLG